MKLYNLMIILGLCVIILSHRCKVDKVDKAKIPKVDLYTHEEVHNFRNLQDTWQPIRIYIDYTHLDDQKTKSTISLDLYGNIKAIIEATVTAYENLILVNRSNRKISIPGCNGLKLSSSVTGDEGIEADVIMVPFVNIDAGENVEASASFCIQESKTGRPLAGSVGFGTNIDFSKTNSKYYYSLLTLHEMNHILCFHSDLFADYIDNSTGNKYKDGVTTDFMVNGVNRQLINTPKVLATARKHFNCPNVVGVELENQGGEGTVGSHWEERVMLGDYMIGESYDEVVISEISLAMFEDSGWYKVNYFTGGLFKFGKNEGCDFLTSKCIDNGLTKFPYEFSTTQRAPMCFSGRTGKGISSLSRYPSAIDKEYQYWTDINEGGQKLADYCPIATSLSYSGIWYANHCSLGKSSLPVSLGETIGPNSYCFISNLTPKDDKSVTAYKNITRSMCHSINCDPTTKSYTITIGNAQAKCPTEGGTINIDGFDGSIICLDYIRMCTKTIPCSDTLDCVSKQSLPLENNLDYTPSAATQTIQGSTNSNTGTPASSSNPSLSNPLLALFNNTSDISDDINLGRDGTTCTSFFGLGCSTNFINLYLLGIIITILISII
jgi:hypothetical protein